MKVTYYGHSSFGVEVGGKHLVFDPFISANPLAAGIKLNDIKADFILVSHAHQDHMLDVEAIANNTGGLVVGCFEVYQYFSNKGLKNVRPLNGGSQFTSGELTIRAVPALHSSSFPDGSYGGLAMGFVITSKEGSFYFAGDTALTYDMKLIGESFQLKFAMLPVGDNFTMGADDAIKTCDFVKCNNTIGMHYDTFDIIKINKDEVRAKFEKAGKKITFLNIGETKEF